MSLTELRHAATTGTVTTMALAAALVMGLAACGSPQSASSTQTTPSSSPSTTLPPVVGKTFGDARSSLVALNVHFEFKGPDGVEYYTAPDSVKITGTDPAAGTPIPPGTLLMILVDANKKDIDAAAAQASASASASAAAAARATRYTFSCNDGSASSEPQTFNDVHAIWASKGGFASCDVDIDGQDRNDRVPLEPDEQQVVQQIGADGGDISIPSAAYGDVLLACALAPKPDWGVTGATSYRKTVTAEAKAAVKMCPDAPFVADLQRVADGIPPSTFTDGTYVVGQDIQAGTYQTQGSVHDCYWERTDGQGGTIANDLITFAPQGPVVTVYAGEGFVSERCGTWSKIG